MSEPEAEHEAPNDDRAIGRNLERLRTSKGMNQTELARMMVEAGCSHFRQNTVSRIERGVQRLRVEEMRALLQVFGPGAEAIWTHVWKKGDDEPFWFRLGHKGDGLPTHFPMSANRTGQGPTEPEPAHHYVCWCGSLECPLTVALQHAWLAGRRSVATPGGAMAELLASVSAEAVQEFAAWVANNRAYNGSKDPGQSLYNDGINGALPKWAEDWIDEQAERSA